MILNVIILWQSIYRLSKKAYITKIKVAASGSMAYHKVKVSLSKAKVISAHTMDFFIALFYVYWFPTEKVKDKLLYIKTS